MTLFKKQFRAACSTLALLMAAGTCSAGADIPGPIESKSPVIPGKGVNVYAAGDIADCRRLPPEETGAAETAEVIAGGLKRHPEAVVLALGDNTYPNGLFNEFVDCFEPTWGQFKKRIMPVPGNHEYYSPNAAGYYRYFGDAAGPAQRGYYSRRIGNWHVIAINSNLRSDAHAEQLQWLKDDLAANKRSCTLAFWHHPRYSSGGHGSTPRMDDVWDVLAGHGADLVLAGHDHHYERFAPMDADGNRAGALGMRSFVVGTGGAHLGSFRVSPKEHSEAFGSSTHGVLKLVLKPTGYEWEFLPTESGGFTDRGAALCNPGTGAKK